MRASVLLAVVIACVAGQTAALSLPAERQAAVDEVIAHMLNGRYEACVAACDSLLSSPQSDPAFGVLALSALGLRDMDYETIVDSGAVQRRYREVLAAVDSMEQQPAGETAYSATLRGFAMASFATYDLRQRKYLRAVRVGLDALEVLERAAGMDSTNSDAGYFLGLYDWSRADLKRKLWWVLFWLPGSRGRGLARMERCRLGACFCGAAAQLSLVDMYVEVRRWDDAASALKWLDQRFGQSRFVWWGKARYHEARGEPADAAAVFAQLADSYQREPIGAYNAAVCRLTQARLAVEAGDTPTAVQACQALLAVPAAAADERIRSVRADAERLLRKLGD